MRHFVSFKVEQCTSLKVEQGISLCIDSMAMPRMLSFWAGLYVSFCSLVLCLLALDAFLCILPVYSFFGQYIALLLIK